MGRFPVLVALMLTLVPCAAAAAQEEPLFPDPIDLNPPHVSADQGVRIDYDIVYVRAPRKGDSVRSHWAEIAHPAKMDAGADLVLLHPDGAEEVLVPGGKGSVADPMVSLDGQWVYYALFHDLSDSQNASVPKAGSDIYKIHVKSRKIVRLTEQTFTPNTGAANWVEGYRKEQNGQAYLPYGVLNLGPCPLPGGKVAFTSSRNAFRPPRGYPTVTLQLFVMDEDGANVEQIGHLNIAGALHPSVLKDGRIVFSSLESQGSHNEILWGIWSMHPDGTKWGPVVSAFDTGSAPNAFHFQSQLSDGSLIVEEYYNLNNNGMGAYFKVPPAPAEGYTGFGPAYTNDPRNPPMRFGRFYNAKGKYYRLPFSPYGIESFTPFANNGEGEADPSVYTDEKSPRVGKFTHPSGAPDNHLLTVWATGPVNHQNGEKLPMPDAGIYLIKDGKPVSAPGEMRLIKNDPNFNEQWPRAVVSYERVYGMKEPARPEPVRNDGRLSKHLPEGSPFGLIGSSSLYKRETYPNGAVPEGSVTSSFAGGHDPTGGYRGLDPFNTSQNGASLNWFNQGADAGPYSNDDIHAVRILAMEPTTDRHRGNYPRDGRLFRSFANERLRILGEIPVRKVDGDGKQPTDPDGNPDTSFLAKIPADTAFTFQTLDKDGMVLNMAQTWHQVRPGEVRNDCGGCHAHSQQPTPFEKTAAAADGYPLFDLTKSTPLLADGPRDESKKKWDAEGETGLRYEPSVKNVEYFRDVKPILQKSCAACHTAKWEQQMGKLVLDDETPTQVGHHGTFPATYVRLAMDDQERSKFGHPPIIHNGSWRNHNASRYVRKFQSRRSLLTWKTHGRRTDGWANDDFPSETVPGDANSLAWKGAPVPNTQENRDRADLDYNGKPCPPAGAVAGTYKAPDGSTVKVEPLTDEERRTVVRWIDLGCPIDLDFDPAKPQAAGYGWMCDDNRPTLAVASPSAGRNAGLARIVVGMHDYYTGLDEKTFSVTASFPVDGAKPGEELAAKFRSVERGVWVMELKEQVASLARGKLVVSVKDRQGNVSRVERTFSVAAETARR